MAFISNGNIQDQTMTDREVYNASSKQDVFKHHLGNFVCNTCNKAFPYKKNYDDHCLIHDVEQISGTGATGSTQSYMTLEKRPVKSYNCDECEKSYSRKDHLKRHKLEHTGQRPHICLVCLKSFVRKDKLTRHEKIHYKDYGLKFSCTDCNKTFFRKDSLDKHRKTHGEQSLTGNTVRTHTCKCKSSATLHESEGKDIGVSETTNSGNVVNSGYSLNSERNVNSGNVVNKQEDENCGLEINNGSEVTSGCTNKSGMNSGSAVNTSTNVNICTNRESFVNSASGGSTRSVENTTRSENLGLNRESFVNSASDVNYGSGENPARGLNIEVNRGSFVNSVGGESTTRGVNREHFANSLSDTNCFMKPENAVYREWDIKRESDANKDRGMNSEESVKSGSINYGKDAPSGESSVNRATKVKTTDKNETKNNFSTDYGSAKMYDRSDRQVEVPLTHPGGYRVHHQPFSYNPNARF